MSKLKDAISVLKGSAKAVDLSFQSENPINGGNAYTANAMFDEIYQSNFNNTDLTSSENNPFVPYGLWFEILQIANYYGCLVNIKTENMSLLRYWEKIHQLAFIFGLVGVEVVGDKLKIYGITNYQIDDYGNYYDLLGIPWNKYLAMVGSGTPNDINYFGQGVALDKNKIFILSNNLNNLNVWLTWVPFLKARDKMLDRLNDVFLSQMKTYLITGISENAAVSQKLIKAIRSPKSFIFNYAFRNENGKLDANKLNVETLDTKLAPLKEFTDTIDWYNRYWYGILGKRNNDVNSNNAKVERSLSGEVELATAGFDVLESYIFNQSKALLAWLKEKNADFEAEITNYAFQDEANTDKEEGTKNNDVLSMTRDELK